MKSKIFIPFLFLLILGITIGCQNSSTLNKKAEDKTNLTSTNPIANKAVKEIKINEGPDNSESPSSSVLQQFEVNFENGETAFPEKDSIITESIIGNKGIVTIRSPEGKNRYAIFLYGKNESWTMEGLMRLGAVESEYYTDNEGLKLPMSAFNADNLQVDEENGKNKEVWAFLDEENIITIARFERTTFDDTSYKTVTLNNGNEAYVTKDMNQNSYLYYFDSEKTIVVSGNVAEEEIITLANSLPSSLASNFPTNK